MQLVIALFLFLVASPLLADQVIVNIKATSLDGVEESIGKISIVEAPSGLVFSSDLKLQGGAHGVSMHVNPSCEPGKDSLERTVLALGAGDVLAATIKDNKSVFPMLVVSGSSQNRQTFLIRGINLEDILQKSIVIRLGGELYANQPIKYAGGASVIACGLILKADVVPSTDEEKKALLEAREKESAAREFRELSTKDVNVNNATTTNEATNDAKALPEATENVDTKNAEEAVQGQATQQTENQATNEKATEGPANSSAQPVAENNTSNK